MQNQTMCPLTLAHDNRSTGLAWDYKSRVERKKRKEETEERAEKAERRKKRARHASQETEDNTTWRPAQDPIVVSEGEWVHGLVLHNTSGKYYTVEKIVDLTAFLKNDSKRAAASFT